MTEAHLLRRECEHCGCETRGYYCWYCGAKDLKTARAINSILAHTVDWEAMEVEGHAVETRVSKTKDYS